MPAATPADSMLLALSTSKAAQIATVVLPQGRRGSVTLADLVSQVVSDRFRLASGHLGCADLLLQSSAFRSSISRNYYAMYHSARAVAFGHHVGDDFEAHSVLPRNLPPPMPNVANRETELMDARLLRNQADYDSYPAAETDWQADARRIAAVAAGFVQACEDYALQSGLI